MAASTGRALGRGVIAGAIATLVMILVQATARIAAGVPMFPDLFLDRAARLILSPALTRVLLALHVPARPLVFAGLLVAQLIAGALIGGAIFSWVAPRYDDAGSSTSPWKNGLILAALLWVVTNVVVLPLAGAGLFGLYAAVGPIGLNVALLSAFALFGLTTVATRRIIDDAAEASKLAGPEVSQDQAVDGKDRRARAGRELA
jgi:hypothetical protein